MSLPWDGDLISQVYVGRWTGKGLGASNINCAQGKGNVPSPSPDLLPPLAQSQEQIGGVGKN